MDLQALKNKYDIIGNDPALNQALETAVKFAPTDLSVVILVIIVLSVMPGILEYWRARRAHPQATPEGTAPE